MTITSLTGSIILITILIPYFLPVVLMIMLGYMGLWRFYTVSSREMKRLGMFDHPRLQSTLQILTSKLDGILRSSLYSHFAESLSGLATIRAYGETSRFIAENARNIDREDSALYLTISELVTYL